MAAAALTGPGDMPVYVILAVAAFGVAAWLAVTLAVSRRRGKRRGYRPVHGSREGSRSRRPPGS